MTSVRRTANDGDEGENRRQTLARRDPLSVSLQQMSEAGLTSEVLAPREHHGQLVKVVSQVTVGIDQRIRLSWTVPFGCYAAGYRLLGYRRTGGFATETSNWDLAQHGIKVIDARHDDAKEESLGQGEYFYTFVLYRTGLLGCVAINKDLVQFSESIPSAKHAIERLEDTIKARKLVRQLLNMASEDRKARKDEEGEGRQPSIVQLLAEQRREIDELKASPEWKKLTKDERDFAIGAVREHYRKKIGVR